MNWQKEILIALAITTGGCFAIAGASVWKQHYIVSNKGPQGLSIQEFPADVVNACAIMLYGGEW